MTNVLILGAGASRHYDFPISREIWDRICVSKADLGDSAILNLGIELEDFKSFSERLKLSGVMSVDAFAEYLIDDATDIFTAKALIAYTLGIFEVRDALHNGRSGHWYRTLANLLIGDDLKSFPRREIAIITFNYERSLERYLFDNLLGRFIKRHNLDELKAAFKRLPIIHIYGQMGALPEFANPGEPMRAFEQISSREQVKTAISGMHLLPEIKRNPALGNRATARECLRNAGGNVTFLGFAYDPENVKALDIAHSHASKVVYGTTMGIGPNAPTDKLTKLMADDLGFKWHPYAPNLDVFTVMEMYPDRILGPDCDFSTRTNLSAGP